MPNPHPDEAVGPKVKEGKKKSSPGGARLRTVHEKEGKGQKDAQEVEERQAQEALGRGERAIALLGFAHLEGQDPLKKGEDLEEEDAADLKVGPKEGAHEASTGQDEEALEGGDQALGELWNPHGQRTR